MHNFPLFTRAEGAELRFGLRCFWFFFTRAEGAELRFGLRCFWFFYSGRRRRVEVWAPLFFCVCFFSFIFSVTFNMQASSHIHECEISLSCVSETKMADKVRILVDCSF